MKKSLLKRSLNRLLNVLVRSCPGSTSLRPLLHRIRGVKIGKGVFVGDEVYIDNEYPEQIEIHDRAAISMRAILIAHNKGPGRIIIEKEAFVGPNVVVACNAGRVIRIGEGAVVGAGCVITKSVPPRAILITAPAQVVGHAAVPLVTAHTIQEFLSGLKPLNPRKDGKRPEPEPKIVDRAEPDAGARGNSPSRLNDRPDEIA